MANTFFYEDGHENVYNEHGQKVLDPMEGVLTEITDPNIVLETITNQKAYLSLKPSEKTAVKKAAVKPKDTMPKTRAVLYNQLSDQTREVFIDRMIERPVQRGLVTQHAKKLGIHPRTAKRWWDKYFEELEKYLTNSRK